MGIKSKFRLMDTLTQSIITIVLAHLLLMIMAKAIQIISRIVFMKSLLIQQTKKLQEHWIVQLPIGLIEMAKVKMIILYNREYFSIKY